MKNKISSNQFGMLGLFIMRSSFLGVASLFLFKTARQDGWISVIIAFLLGLIPLFMFLFIHNYNKKASIMQLCDELFGKWIGKLILIILTIFIFFIGTYALLDLTNFINSQYLNRTPTYFIAIVFMVALVYMLFKGLKVIARTGGVLIFGTFILLILSMLGLFNEIDLSNLKPFLESGIFPVIKGSIGTIGYIVLPLFLLLMIPKDQIEDPKKTNRYFITYYCIGFLTIVIVVFFILSIYGIDLANLYQYPEFHILKMVSLVGIFDRVEGILSLQWIFDLFIFIALCYYFVHQSIKYMLKMKKEKPSKLIILVIGISSIILSEFFFKNTTQQNEFIINKLPMFLYIVLLGIPVLIFFMCVIRKLISFGKNKLSQNTETKENA